MSADGEHRLSHGEIMLVEDNASDLRLLSDILTKAGHRVRPASDGELALSGVRAKPPELILLGVNPPTMDGVELCRRLKADPGTMGLPVIFISSLGETGLKVKALEAGGVDYVTKPFKPAEVLARINTHLNLHRLQRSLAVQSEKLIIEIEERKRAEETLRQSEAFNKGIVESSRDCIKVLDLEGRLLFMSRGGQNLLEIEDLEPYLNELWVEFWKGDDRRAAGESIAKAREGDVGFFEGYCPTAAGTPKWWEIIVSPILGADDRPLRLLAISRDITERKQVEKAFWKSERRLRTLMGNLPGMAYRCPNQPDWPMNFVSGGCLALTGYSAEELTGAAGPAYGDLIHPDDRPMVWDRVQEAVRRGEPFVIEYRLRDKEGVERWVWERGQAVDEHRDGAAILEGFISDITEGKRAEEELRSHRENLEELVAERTAELEKRVSEVERLNRAMVNLSADFKIVNASLESATRKLTATNKELEAFSYSVSHDLRAPLRHIAGFVEILQESSARTLDETGRRHLETIAKSTGRMGCLIDDLLALSRVGRTEMRQTRVNLERMVGELTEEIQEQAPDREIVWETGALPPVRGDASLLRQVFVNLLSNAVKYTLPRQPARIEIGVTPGDENELVFFVRDNGIGFDMNYAHKLFGVFQRLHRQDEYEGTGIGLANVRRIVNRHGGRTWAEGVVDRGSTFYFSLPASSEAGQGKTE